MDAQLIAELAQICQATRIESPDAFSFAGWRFQAWDTPSRQAPVCAARQPPLLRRLQYQLYVSCYCQRFNGALPDKPPPDYSPYTQPIASPDHLLQALAAANTGRERWEAGWQIYQLEPAGQVLAHKGGRTHRIGPGQFRNRAGAGSSPRVGAQISVLCPKESLTLQQGFYFAFGETSAEADADNLLRFYWNISEAGAPSLIRWLTHDLNRFQVPFRLKCWTNWALFSRADAAVLYVDKRFYQITSALIADAYPQLQGYLRPETPLFTKQLAPGLGLAEDPGNGESFGANCCALLSHGLWNAYIQGQRTGEAQLASVVEQCRLGGMNLAHPYLSPGSIDLYPFPGVGATHDA